MALSRLAELRQLATDTVGATKRDTGRLVQNLDTMLRELPSQFVARWKRATSTITASTTRPSLKFDELASIDTNSGDVIVTLPLGKSTDAGRRTGFIKKYRGSHVDVQTADGSLINAVYQRVDAFTQIGVHEFLWDGSGWWFREPAARAQLHSATPGTLGLWQFSPTSLLTDDSGFGRNLTVETGTERYSRLSPTLHGFFFDGSTSLIYNTADSGLRLTGDMTFMCLWVTHTGVTLAPWVSHLAPGALESQNTLYRFGHGTYPQTQFSSESGAGVSASYTLESLLTMLGQMCHVAVTRTSGVVQMYQNGKPFGAASSVLTTPTGGADGRLRLGSTSTTHAHGCMASAKLVNRAYTAAEIRAEYHRTMGQPHGFVDEFV